MLALVHYNAIAFIQEKINDVHTNFTFTLVSARFAETENLKKRLSKTFSLDELNPAEITNTFTLSMNVSQTWTDRFCWRRVIFLHLR